MIGLLRQRDFRLLWVGETTSKLGSAVTMVALPLVAVISLHANTFTVSALEAAAWLPWLLIGLPAGAWVDRLPRRAVMITCDVISAALFASVPIAAWLGWLSIGQLLAVALLTGVCTVFFQTSYQVYLPTVVRESELTEANAKLLGSESAGQVVGPGLGGLLAQLFGAVFGLLVDALSFVVSAFCLLRIRASEALPAKEKRAPLHREIGEGLRFVFHDPYLRTLVIYAGVSNLVSNGFMAVMVPFLVRDIGLAPGLVGVYIAVAGAGGVVGALLVRSLVSRLGNARAMVLADCFGIPFLVLIPLTPAGPAALLSAAGFGVSVAAVVVGNVITGTFRQNYCPTHLLGRVVSSGRLVGYGANPIGSLLGGGLASFLGNGNTIWIMTAATAVSVLILVCSPIGRRRELPAAHPDREPSMDLVENL